MDTIKSLIKIKLSANERLGINPYSRDGQGLETIYTVNTDLVIKIQKSLITTEVNVLLSFFVHSYNPWTVADVQNMFSYNELSY